MRCCRRVLRWTVCACLQCRSGAVGVKGVSVCVYSQVVLLGTYVWNDSGSRFAQC